MYIKLVISINKTVNNFWCKTSNKNISKNSKWQKIFVIDVVQNLGEKMF